MELAAALWKSLKPLVEHFIKSTELAELCCRLELEDG
jgi:hypothetical protein